MSMSMNMSLRWCARHERWRSVLFVLLLAVQL